MLSSTKFSLTGNQLKSIAMVTMTLDHMGLMLFPGVALFRILGRLSMPIYAYMIAEGCRHTRDRKRYFLRLLGLGVLCQIVYFVAMGSLYLSILITFSLSVGLIMALERQNIGLALAALTGTWFVCEVMPGLLPGTDFGVDYGIAGVFLPILVYFGRTKKEKLLLFAVSVGTLAWNYGGNQWFGLGTIPLIALYNGQRGRANIGKLFYFYYPAHLVVLYGISMIL